MSEEQQRKEYSNEMRGTLWVLGPDERKEKGPVAAGYCEISGVRVRVAMWAKKVAATGKAAGKTYIPISFEYPQGATAFLAKCAPRNVVVTGAMAGDGQPPAAASVGGADADNLDDIPF